MHLFFADFLLQPKSLELSQLMATSDRYVFIIRPIALEIAVAVVVFVWVRSALQSLRRADRAEVVAELMRRDAEQKQDLEAGIRELLAVHTEVANGNFRVRSTASRGSVLWLISTSLNNLIGRMQVFAQADYIVQRTQVEAHNLAESLRFWRPGQNPVWPAPSNTPLDEVIVIMRRMFPSSGAAGHGSKDAHSAAPAASQSMPQPPPMQPSQWNRPLFQGPGDLPQTNQESDLPEWLRQQMSSGKSSPSSQASPFRPLQEGTPGGPTNASYTPQWEAFDQPGNSPGDDPWDRR